MERNIGWRRCIEENEEALWIEFKFFGYERVEAGGNFATFVDVDAAQCSRNLFARRAPVSRRTRQFGPHSR